MGKGGHKGVGDMSEGGLWKGVGAGVRVGVG